MSEIVEQKEEKVFKYFLDLPLKARMELIDSMQPDDRCRLTRCSKQCNKEAKSSKNFMSDLSLGSIYENEINIYVKYHSTNRDMGYVLEFKDEWNEKNMTCRSQDYKNRREFWRIELDYSTNMVEFAVQIFKNLMQLYQKSIKCLEITGEKFRGISFDSGIEKFDNLHRMFLHDNDVSKLFSKLTRPLSFLNYRDRKNESSLADYEQMYHVDDLIAGNVQLDYQQLRRLTASRASLHIGKLTEMDVFHFVKAWQRGELQENFNNCNWGLKGSNFDVQKLFSLFGVEMVDDGKTGFSTDIIYDKDPSKICLLYKSQYGSLGFTKKLPFVRYF